MTKVFDILSENRLLPGPEGMGAKVVQGHMKIEPASEAVHHSDVNLNTIKALFIEQPAIGSFVVVDVVARGTYDNYASLTAYYIGSLAGTLVLGGYPQAKTSGAIDLAFMAFGE